MGKKKTAGKTPAKRKPYVAVPMEKFTAPHSKRYAIVDIATGEALDDSQGYGYRSPRRAYMAYEYKMGVFPRTPQPSVTATQAVGMVPPSMVP